MLHNQHFRLASLFLVFVFFPLSALSQDNPPTVQSSDWGDWKSAPNFPGIKIRVLCSTYLQSTGKAEWNYQFQNTYSKKVYLVYQDEAVGSTGAPPTFSSPSGRNLDPGEKSAAYTDYLKGTCDSRKQIFIRVVSISDDNGNHMQARAGSSRPAGFERTPRPSPAAQTRLGQPQGSGTTSQPSALGAAGAVPGSSGGAGSAANTLVGTWRCAGRATYYTGQSDDFNFTVIFAADGTWELAGDSPWSLWGTRIGDNARVVNSRWTQTGSTFNIPYIKSEAPLSGRFTDAAHIQMTHPAGSPYLDPRNGAETEACERVATPKQSLP